MRIDDLRQFAPSVPRFPFKDQRAPKMDISGYLAQVAQVWHRRKGLHLCHFGYDFIEEMNGGTGGTGENQLNAHARAHACARVIIFFHYFLISIKNTCSTCASIEFIEVSPVPLACANLFHLCQKG